MQEISKYFVWISEVFTDMLMRFQSPGTDANQRKCCWATVHPSLPIELKKKHRIFRKNLTL